MIEFDSKTGYLPQGVHRMTLGDFADRFAWNEGRRRLHDGLKRAILSLRLAGCRAILINGSFVTSKELPGDWDAAFDPAGMDSRFLDPILLKHDDGRRAMRAKYFGDIFPWTALSGGAGSSLYREFFQHDRDGHPKGIVEILLQGAP